MSSSRATVSFVPAGRFGYRVADVVDALGPDVVTVSVMVSRLASRLESSDVVRPSRNA